MIRRVEDFYKEKSSRGLWLDMLIGLIGATFVFTALILFDYEQIFFALSALLCCLGGSLAGTGGLLVHNNEQVAERLIRIGCLVLFAGMVSLTFNFLLHVVRWVF